MLYHLLKQQVAQMILETATAKNQAFCEQQTKLATDTQTCRHADFRYLSYLTGISITTLKRLFNCEAQGVRFCNAKNQQKIAHFLGYATWDEVEGVILDNLIDKKD
ncbi:hypothetical protein BKI52_25210 [marine bacterium AO1-C]|nr:hypothetical protein BKI52_25210 [marine bacterium AO1-C]